MGDKFKGHPARSEGKGVQLQETERLLRIGSGGILAPIINAVAIRIGSRLAVTRIVGAQAKNVRTLEYLFRVMLGESQCGKLVVSRPTVTERPPREKFKSNPKWGAANIKGIIEGVAKAIWGSNATRVHCFDQGPDLTIGEVVLHAQTGNSRFYERGAVHAALRLHLGARTL